MKRKGADKILSIYWFLILVLVAGGIFLMVYTFYHHPIDVREEEASLLEDKVAGCISQGGEFTSGIMVPKSGGTNNDLVFNKNLKDESYFLNYCNITFNLENEKGWKSGSEYYLNVSFFDIKEVRQFSLFSGNKDLLSDCSVVDKKGNKLDKPSKCVYRGLYVVGTNGKQYLVQILSVVRKSEKNVK